LIDVECFLRGKPLQTAHGIFKELALAYCDAHGLREDQVSFGSSNLRKKAATAVSEARHDGKISAEDQQAFAASELHNIDVENKYYIESSFAPGKVRPISTTVSFNGMAVEDVLKERTRLIRKGELSFLFNVKAKSLLSEKRVFFWCRQ